MVTESNAGMVSSFADCSSRPLTDPAVPSRALLFSAVCDSGPVGVRICHDVHLTRYLLLSTLRTALRLPSLA